MALRIFLAFAFGYFVSYSFRTIGALIAPDLARELTLDASELGLLGSAFFFTFAVLQLPYGIALDRYGPRRVNGSLFAITALGAALFALSTNFVTAFVGRAVIGAGVAVALMSAFKSFVIWYPPEKREMLSAFMMAVGGVAAMTMASPAEWAMRSIGWRGVIAGLGVASVLVAGLIWWLVPDPPRAASPAAVASPGSLALIGGLFTDWRFMRYAPMAFFGSGGFSSIQALWAGPFLIEVTGLTRAGAAHTLLCFGAGMLVGYILIGSLVARLTRIIERHGGGGSRAASEWIYVGGLLIAQSALAMIAANWFPGKVWVWMLYGGTLGTSMLAYPALTKAFPVSIAARVMTTYNVLMFVGAFALQWGMGALIDVLMASGMPKALAYQWSFGGVVALQFLSVLWFWFTPRGSAQTP